MPKLWADGLWASGLWANGLWDTGSTAAESTAYSGTPKLFPGGRGVLHVGSTNVVELASLYDMTAEVFVTDATVTATLEDESGNPVAGATDVQLPLVDGTSGWRTMYRAAIAHTVSLADGDKYKLTVTVNHNGNVRRFKMDCMARVG